MGKEQSYYTGYWYIHVIDFEEVERLGKTMNETTFASFWASNSCY